jgi:hypothetical protein
MVLLIISQIISTDRSVGSGNKKMPDALGTHRAREVGDLSLFLNTHVAQFVGVVLGLKQIGRSAEDEHRDTDDYG